MTIRPRIRQICLALNDKHKDSNQASVLLWMRSSSMQAGGQKHDGDETLT